MDNFVENFIVSIDLSSFSFLDENGILLSQELLFCKQGVLHGYHLSWGIGSNDVNTLVFRINVAPLLLFWRKSFQQHALIRTTTLIEFFEKNTFKVSLNHQNIQKSHQHVCKFSQIIPLTRLFRQPRLFGTLE